MTRPAVIRFLAPLLLAMMALAACGDGQYAREGAVVPRGTALPPPDPVTGAARTALPGR